MSAGFRQIFPGKRELRAPAAALTQQAKLEQLFENRNRIKRELDQVRAERKLLQDELQSLRRRHLESQRQLGSLEHMLADAERGQSALVYYRLRAVWNTCRRQVQILAQDLNGRFENAERAEFEQHQDKDRGRRLDDLTRQFEQLERERRNLRNGLQNLQRQREGLSRFWQKGRREVVQFQIDKVTRQFGPIETRKLGLLSAIEGLRDQNPRPWPGIGTASKRTVNLWLLALAQYLYVHLARCQIAEMARSAGTKPISDVNFGLLNDCLAIGNHIYEAVVRLRRDRSRPDTLRAHTERLRYIATYASDEDTVPEESCLEYIAPPISTDTVIDAHTQAVAVNVLRLNYWDVQSSLLRPAESGFPVGPKSATAEPKPVTMAAASRVRRSHHADAYRRASA